MAQKQPRRCQPGSNMNPEPNEAAFEPEITAFYCIYCGFMAADAAGAMGIQYPANVKFVRLPCTGKTDVRYILEAFEQGVDGVYVVACPIGNCHHVRGNERGRARLAKAADILENVGLERERLGMFFMSGSQAQAFAAAAHTMTERIRQLGPNPLNANGSESDKEEGTDPNSEEHETFRGRHF